MVNAAWENLLGAIQALTTSEPIKQRFVRAFSNHLEKIDPLDLPRDARVVFRELVQKLSATEPMRGETAIAATVRKMSNSEIEACAQAVVQLLSHCGRAQVPETELPSGVVPLYPVADSVPPLVALNRA